MAVVVHRKTAPRVVGGRALRKNRHEVTRDLVDPTRREPLIARERPGRGYRHVVGQRDVARFLSILADWDELSRGLHAIVLAAGSKGLAGWHRAGVVYLCAWETDLVREVAAWHWREHESVLARIGVPCEPIDDDLVRCQFDESTARAYQLVHVLAHELGHRHDRMTTRSQRGSRGEAYAERFAREREALLWSRYTRTFRL